MTPAKDPISYQVPERPLGLTTSYNQLKQVSPETVNVLGGEFRLNHREENMTRMIQCH